jgi:hypothetical protein
LQCDERQQPSNAEVDAGFDVAWMNEVDECCCGSDKQDWLNDLDGIGEPRFMVAFCGGCIKMKMSYGKF